MKNLATKEKLMSEAEYLAFEAKSKIRHEFMDGEIFAMVGSPRKHNLIATNVLTELDLQLREKNAKFTSVIFESGCGTGITFIPMSQLPVTKFKLLTMIQPCSIR